MIHIFFNLINIFNIFCTIKVIIKGNLHIHSTVSEAKSFIVLSKIY
jgi:hypothetical protein